MLISTLFYDPNSSIPYYSTLLLFRSVEQLLFLSPNLVVSTITLTVFHILLQYCTKEATVGS